MGIRPKLKNKRREITPLKSIKHHQMSLRFPGSAFPYNTPFSVFFFSSLQRVYFAVKEANIDFFFPTPLCSCAEALFSMTRRRRWVGGKKSSVVLRGQNILL